MQIYNYFGDLCQVNGSNVGYYSTQLTLKIAISVSPVTKRAVRRLNDFLNRVHTNFFAPDKFSFWHYTEGNNGPSGKSARQTEKAKLEYPWLGV